ncbi:MAG: hypothetical protein CMI18_13365 [Opitutaceae bacterium]|nr:hypothetical protein [Opitutaceae bacterium]
MLPSEKKEINFSVGIRIIKKGERIPFALPNKFAFLLAINIQGQPQLSLFQRPVCPEKLPI